jgi:hypothetical protein
MGWSNKKEQPMKNALLGQAAKALLQQRKEFGLGFAIGFHRPMGHIKNFAQRLL